MEDAAAILADYADFRLVKTRKVMQIICEVPIENAENVTKKLGWPNPHEGVAVAIALVDMKPDGTLRKNEKPKKDSRTRHAAILCQQDGFKHFLRQVYRNEWNKAVCIVTDGAIPDTAQTHEVAAIVVRTLCDIKSRSELDKYTDNSAPILTWDGIVTRYRSYQAENQYEAELSK